MPSSFQTSLQITGIPDRNRWWTTGTDTFCYINDCFAKWSTQINVFHNILLFNNVMTMSNFLWASNYVFSSFWKLFLIHWTNSIYIIPSLSIGFKLEFFGKPISLHTITVTFFDILRAQCLIYCIGIRPQPFNVNQDF